jgi:hypothetical protein
MIGKILGALVGAAIDRSDGEGGAKGAAIGAISVGVAKRIVPIALLITGVVIAKKLIDDARGEEV